MEMGKIVQNSKNNTDKAIMFYKKSIDANPNFYEVYEVLAKSYKTKSMKKEAMKSLKKCIYLAPQYYPAYFELGILNREEGYE